MTLALPWQRFASALCAHALSALPAKDTHNLGFEFREFHGEHRTMRMKDQVAPRRQQVKMTAQRFAQPPLDAIALVRFAQDLADSETDARARRSVRVCRRQKPAHRG